MADTKIEWADKVWNPVTGCSKVSPGCANCYADRMAKRLAGRFGYPKDEPFRVTWHPDRLLEPYRWKKPRSFFVCSMGDLFHEDVHFKNIARIWDVMFDCSFTEFKPPHHIFIVLTKRPQRMKQFFHHLNSIGRRADYPNIWLGVSVENQKTADERIPILLQIPAKVRFVSIEPMLGPVDLFKFINFNKANPLARWHDIDWVILGGETGPKARSMEPDWARSVRHQCQEARIPFFFKQWGEWVPKEWPRTDWGLSGLKSTWFMDKVGKKAAGRILDGRTWEEFPVY